MSLTQVNPEVVQLCRSVLLGPKPQSLVCRLGMMTSASRNCPENVMRAPLSNASHVVLLQLALNSRHEENFQSVSLKALARIHSISHSHKHPSLKITSHSLNARLIYLNPRTGCLQLWKPQGDLGGHCASLERVQFT